MYQAAGIVRREPEKLKQLQAELPQPRALDFHPVTTDQRSEFAGHLLENFLAQVNVAAELWRTWCLRSGVHTAIAADVLDTIAMETSSEHRMRLVDLAPEPDSSAEYKAIHECLKRNDSLGSVIPADWNFEPESAGGCTPEEKANVLELVASLAVYRMVRLQDFRELSKYFELAKSVASDQQNPVNIQAYHSTRAAIGVALAAVEFTVHNSPNFKHDARLREIYAAEEKGHFFSDAIGKLDPVFAARENSYVDDEVDEIYEPHELDAPNGSEFEVSR